MSSLPFDIIIRVLYCLPVKSLLRFKTVCKLWHSLIDDPYFTKLHVARSFETRNLLLYIKLDYLARSTFPRDEVSRVDLISLENDHGIVPYQELDRSHLKDARFCGSFSDGLLVLYKYSTSSLVFWNPSTKKVFPAPSSRMKLYHRDLETIQVENFNNDHKVVVIRRNRRRLDFVLYSLEAKCWTTIYSFISCREIEIESCSSSSMNLGDMAIQRGNCILFNGALHWLVWRQDEAVLIAFDLGLEESYELTIPSFADYKVGYMMNLGVFEGSLCVSFIKRDGDYCELWVMKEYKVIESWIKLASFPKSWNNDFFCYKQALAYSKNLDKVLVEFSSGGLCWYDLKTETFTEIQLQIGLAFTICPASLASIDADGVNVQEENSRKRRRTELIEWIRGNSSSALHEWRLKKPYPCMIVRR